MTDSENRFRIETPEGWGSVKEGSGLVWHVASNGGTQLPSCSVKVTKDDAFAILTNDEYIERQSMDDMKRVLSMSYSDVQFGLWEPDFNFAGQRALHYVNTGTRDGVTITTMGLQTIRFGRLYTFSCNAMEEDFPGNYSRFLKISDTFSFVGDDGG